MMAEPKVLQPGDVGYHRYPKAPDAMESLGDIFARFHRDGSLIPSDAVCQVCAQAIAGHPFNVAWLGKHPGEPLRVCRCQVTAMERLTQANFPPDGPRTFDNFHAREGTRDMVDAGLQFIADKINGNGPRRMVIQGAYGCGKSHIVEAIGRVWLSWGERVLYEGVPTLMDKLRATYNRGTEDSVGSLLNHCYAHRLLLLDDLGAEKSSAGGDGYVAEQMTKIWDNHPWHLVITTNKTQREMADKLGDRLASRMYSANPALSEVRFVINTAEDYRA